MSDISKDAIDVAKKNAQNLDVIETYKNNSWIQEKYTLKTWLNEWKKAMLRK